jgi:hypothetical protein
MCAGKLRLTIEGLDDEVTIDVNGRATRGWWHNPDYDQILLGVCEGPLPQPRSGRFPVGRTNAWGPLMNAILA